MFRNSNEVEICNIIRVFDYYKSPSYPQLDIIILRDPNLIRSFAGKRIRIGKWGEPNFSRLFKN